MLNGAAEASECAIKFSECRMCTDSACVRSNRNKPGLLTDLKESFKRVYRLHFVSRLHLKTVNIHASQFSCKYRTFSPLSSLFYSLFV